MDMLDHRVTLEEAIRLEEVPPELLVVGRITDKEELATPVAAIQRESQVVVRVEIQGAKLGAETISNSASS